MVSTWDRYNIRKQTTKPKGVNVSFKNKSIDILEALGEVSIDDLDSDYPQQLEYFYIPSEDVVEVRDYNNNDVVDTMRVVLRDDRCKRFKTSDRLNIIDASTDEVLDPEDRDDFEERQMEYLECYEVSQSEAMYLAGLPNGKLKVFPVANPKRRML